MLLVLGYRKSRVLDVCFDFSRIDVGQTRFPKALTDKDLRSRDVIGGQRRIRGSRGYRRELTFLVADIVAITVAPANPPYIANVVTKQRDQKVEPVARGYAALLDVFPAQDLLAYQRHHDGVVHVVVARITIGDILQGQARHESNDIRIVRFEDAIDLAVHVSKLLDKCLDDNLCGIEHDRL